MVNVASIDIANNVYGVVRDYRDGVQFDGNIIQANPNTISGIFAYASTVDIVNMYPFGITPTKPTITVKSVKVSGLINTVSSDPTLICTQDIGTSFVLIVQPSCGIVLTSTLKAGGKVTVTVSLGSQYSTKLMLSVWFPSSVTVTANRYDLNEVRVQTPNAIPNCALYLTAQIAVIANFTSGSNSINAYVTRYVTFTNSNPFVATVDMSQAGVDLITIQGNSTGNTTLKAKLFGSAITSISNNGATFTVRNDTYLQLTTVSLIAYTGVTATMPRSVNLYDTVTPTFTLTDVLTAEGARAYLSAIAGLEDGTSMDVTYMVYGISSKISDVIVLNNTVGAPLIQVAVGANSFDGVGLNVSLKICGNVLNGEGRVNLVMPPPASVLIVPSSKIITSVLDLASSAPFNVPTYITVPKITLVFTDSTTRDISADPRVTMTLSTIIEGSTLLYLVGSTIRVNISSPDYSSKMYKSFTLDVDFDQTVSTSFTFELLTVSHIRLDSAAFPVYGNSDQDYKSIISRLDCGNNAIYQRLHTLSVGYLTANPSATSQLSFRIDNIVTLSFNTTNSPISISNMGLVKGVIAGVIPGTAVVTAYLTNGIETFQSNGLMITVNNDFVGVSSIAIGTGIFSVGPTFRAVYNTTKMLPISLTFTDGTQYLDAVSGVSVGWISVGNILQLSSSVPTSIFITLNGAAILIDNYIDVVILAASTICPGPIASSSVEVYANLLASPYDIDMGFDLGPPFGIGNLGDTITVPVRLQSSSLDILAFQVVITFDSSIIQVSGDADCTVGNGWGASFDCTTNDPPNQVLIIGACGLIPATLCKSIGLLQIAEITFTVVGAGTTGIGGTRIKIQDVSNSVSMLPIIAGADNFTSYSYRRVVESLEMDEAAALRRSITMNRIYTPPTQRLLGTTGCVAGDTNGDGVFDIADAVFLQYYIAGAYLNSNFTSCQKVAMDPDVNGAINGVDIQYLMRTVAKKYRFLKYISIFNAGTVYNISGYLVDDTNSPVAFDEQTALNYEIGADNLVISQGINYTISPDLLLGANGLYGTEPGTFFVQAVAPEYTVQQIEIEFSVVTYDVFGSTSVDRQFSFYCSPTISLCASVYGAGLSAYFPYAILSAFKPPTHRPTARPTTRRPTHTPSTPDPTTSIPTHPTAIPTATPTFAPSSTPSSAPTCM